MVPSYAFQPAGWKAVLASLTSHKYRAGLIWLKHHPCCPDLLQEHSWPVLPRPRKATLPGTRPSPGLQVGAVVCRPPTETESSSTRQPCPFGLAKPFREPSCIWRLLQSKAASSRPAVWSKALRAFSSLPPPRLSLQRPPPHKCLTHLIVCWHLLLSRLTHILFWTFSS